MSPKEPRPARRGAGLVAAGMLTSRVSGLVREGVIATLFGSTGFADVFTAAMRGPNVLQNLLGEQALSAAFIPIYVRKLAEDEPQAAARFAGAIFGLMVAITGTLALLGVLFAPILAGFLFPGFLLDATAVAEGRAAVDRFPYAVRALRILFPMAGVLALSAWSLAVLNSHRRFFLSYSASALWNLSIIVALVWVARISPGEGGEGAHLERILIAGCIGALVGGGLQFLVQLPLALRLLGGLNPIPSFAVPGVREAVRAFGPAVAGRGVVQLSFWVELALSTGLAAGAVVTLQRAQRLVGLPVSLFGGAIAAAELPELSGLQASTRATPALAGEDTHRSGQSEARLSQVLVRLRTSIAMVLYLAVPSAVACCVFGTLMVGAIYGYGRFGSADTLLVTAVLAVYGVGIIPNSTARLLQNAFFAQGDTSTPAKIAALRLLALIVLAFPLMLLLDRVMVAELGALASRMFGGASQGVAASRLSLGAGGLALASVIVGWVELLALLSRLKASHGPLGLPFARGWRFLAAALLAAVPAMLVWQLVVAQAGVPGAVSTDSGKALPPIVMAPLILGIFGSSYLFISIAARFPEFYALRLPGFKRQPGSR